MQDRFEFSIMGLLEILAPNLKISYFIVTFKSIVKDLSDNESIIFFISYYIVARAIFVHFCWNFNCCCSRHSQRNAASKFRKSSGYVYGCSSAWKRLTSCAIFSISTGKISYTNSDGLVTWNPGFGFWNCHGFKSYWTRFFFIYCLKLVNKHDRYSVFF